MSDWITKSDDPIEVFKSWYELNLQSNTFEPTTMTLATVDTEGMPSARVVLLKECDQEGFCFFTNYESAKGQELINNPRGALVFHWEKPFHRQVRVRGLVDKVSYERSNNYFQKRNRGSQIGAWASPQSQKIKDRSELETLVKNVEKKFADGPVPCPKNWGGFCLQPLSIEFWEGREHRLHDRMRFTRENLSEPWSAQRLAP